MKQGAESHPVSQPARQAADAVAVASDWKAPVWSPDGEYIAFAVAIGERAAESGVIIVRPDGSDLQYASALALEPDWQPLPVTPPTD